jgi:hypothetical protein
VRSLSFYQWDDEPVISRGPGTRAYTGWQSGLRFVNGQPKPALAVFPAPLVVDRTRSLLWGQVRPAAASTVTLQIRRPGGDFMDFEDVPLEADGAFLRRVTLAPGVAYRYRWTDASMTPRFSGVVDLAKPEKTQLRAASS